MTASYVVTKPGSDFKAAGPLPPMTSVTGPHYGRNINLAGPGLVSQRPFQRPAFRQSWSITG
ncbi:Periplasmic protein p19 involved in high-affinity Fe2+ transport [Paramagnetospirillum magnetotacticum MS-1]|uniref:Periplasmic protein p19 involved in high-affinity Fe2+ transport n=1 Tax=Paramagnetospirillum magnetotacticum MS-1 TaxID=272627 RepID=A0A0C2YPU2_PARME|nr:Periplasmic protein p19 involved in high-affinity Fe2+ transport [Paramagnetospirillum magnetotacticum MS-1]